MRCSTATLKMWISRFLLSAILSNIFLGLNLSLPLKIRGQNRPVIITADQPNVWTLEQAHYLIQQLHRRNLDLRAKNLDNLDANAINGVNIDILRTMLDIQAAYNQGVGLDNKLTAQSKEYNADRREQLLNQRDSLNQQNLALVQDIARLESQIARSKNRTEIDELGLQLDEKKAVQAVVKEQLTQVNGELTSLSSTTGSFGAATLPTPAGSLPKGALDSAMTRIINGLENKPSLNASLQLDNYIQLQYEILAKQLTLLRQEVGPGQRLIFLEMPQSINTARGKADKKWAQTWFRVAGYTCLPNDDPDSACYDANLEKKVKVKPTVEAKPQPKPEPGPEVPRNENKPDQPQNTEINPPAQNQQSETMNTGEAKKTEPQTTPSPKKDDKSVNTARTLKDAEKQEAKYIDLSNSIKIKKEMEDCTIFNKEIKLCEKQCNKEDSDEKKQKCKEKCKEEADDQTTECEIRNKNNIIEVSNPIVRVVDMIPKQGSLNVNDVKLRTNESGFGFLASWLFGFGASAKYKREREQFSQFVQQELYSSGFGKGSREFGWTYTPMPGASRLLSGTRTTYAVLVIPENATNLILEASGCYFPRSAYQPTDFNETQQNAPWSWEVSNQNQTDNIRFGNDRMCTEKKSFIIPIPSGYNAPTFDVTEIEYQSVEPNERVTVRIRGNNFPTQVGVIVAGKPLIQSIGIAQPLINDDSIVREKILNQYSPDSAGIYGEFERLNDKQIVFWVKMPNGYKGTPPISVVAPGEAKFLNSNPNLKVIINGKEGTQRLDASDYMFGIRTADSCNGLSVDGVDVFRTATDNKVSVFVRGKNLKANTTTCANQTARTAIMYVNDKEFNQTSNVPQNDLLWRVESDVLPTEEYIQVTILSQGAIFQLPKIKNPYYTPPNNSKPELTQNPEKLKVSEICGAAKSVQSATGEIKKITVKLKGLGLDKSIKASPGKFTATADAKEAYLEIDDPEPFVRIKLSDEKNWFTNVSFNRQDFLTENAPCKTNQ